jgi:trk system potassium uptake protein TrkH
VAGGNAIRRRRRLAAHPARVVVLSFGSAALLGTGLLLLPFATAPGADTSPIDALFTATSAVSVTGLVVVDTGGHWSRFGQLVILALMQLGGFGIMTLSSLVALLFSRRLGLRQRLIAQTETNTLDAGDVRRVVKGVALVSVLVEGAAAIVLTWRFAVDQDVGLAEAAYRGVFHAVSAFNNAGFSLFSDSLVAFVGDWWLCLTIGVAVIAGGIGFPVWTELRTSLLRPRRWSLHTKLTVGTTLVLIVAGTALIAASEWTNPATLGDLAEPERLLASWFQSVSPRTAGFNTLDYGQMRQGSLLITDGLMYIGGGSASTAGGIKVATFGLLGFVAWAEVRGEPEVNAFGRRVPAAAQRQAVTLVLLSVGIIAASTLVLVTLEDLTLSSALFEVISAFSTVGLSTGITGGLGGAAQALLTALMFLGRVGPITLFAALLLREHGRLYRLPSERPIIG